MGRQGDIVSDPTKALTEKVKQSIAAALFAALLYTPAASQRPQQAVTGKVVGVSDGHTLTVLDEQKRQHKIRISGIDAPESSQDFGSRAKQSLSDLVFGKTVTVIGSNKDRYGRTVDKVMLSDGKDMNLEQIDRGMAWFYRQYAKELEPEDARAYEQAEIAAREEKVGLWADPHPLPPWDFRRGKTAKAPGAKPTMPATGPIVGNRNSKIYHLLNCPDYPKVAVRNRVPFKTEAEAQAAGYRRAKNCP